MVLTFQGAKDYCQQKGGDLLIVQDAQIQRWIEDVCFKLLMVITWL